MSCILSHIGLLQKRSQLNEERMQQLLEQQEQQIKEEFASQISALTTHIAQLIQASVTVLL